MYRFLLRPLAVLAFALCLAPLTGCDSDGLFGDDEQEVEGTVEAVGDDFLTVDAIDYAVTADTEFEGYTGLDDIEVGDEVEIEYEERDSGRVALEIEDPSAEDDD
ncbi:MAG: DUF5666 domain-containing protein [Rhodothermales bacterium]|nr:DUF5666 domain-containing protein [Rhodothermales bacterium]